MPGPVLLVHDDISVIAPVKRVLQRQGVDTLLVTGAADAVITFGDLSPSVVVVSPEVDGGRGGSICQEIRNHPRGANTKFIVLGKALPEAPDAALVSLPLDADALLEAVRKAFQGKEGGSAWHFDAPAAAPGAPPAEMPAQAPAGTEDLGETLFGDEPPGPAQGTAPEPIAAAPPTPAIDLAQTLFGDLPSGGEAEAAPAARSTAASSSEKKPRSPLGEAWVARTPVPAGMEGEPASRAPEKSKEAWRIAAVNRVVRGDAKVLSEPAVQKKAPAPPSSNDEELKKRNKAEATQRATEELKRKIDERRIADQQKRKAEEDSRKKTAEAERLRLVEELKKEADEAAQARQHEEMAQKAEAQRKLQEDARVAEGVKKEAEQQRRKAEEQKKRLEAESAELSRQREEIKKQSELAQRQLQEDARKVADLKKSSLEEQRTLEEEHRRLEEQSAELSRQREEARQRLESARLKLEEERAQQQELEKEARALAEAAEQKATSRAELAKRTLLAREGEVRRLQGLRRQEQEAIREREAEALRAQQASQKRSATAEGEETARSRPFAVGRWRGPVRITELVERAPANDQPGEESSLSETSQSSRSGLDEGFKTTPPPAPSEPPFPPRGTLAQPDAPTLFCRAFDARLTGRIDVAAPEAQRTLWFEEGRLVSAASSLDMERLEEIALRSALISRAQHHALRTYEERLARRLALQMVELGYIRSTEMYPLVCQRVTEIAFSIFLDEESAYVFSSESPPAEERVVLPMHPFALATEGIRRKFSAERLWARLGGPGTLLRPRGQGLELDYFGLSARERRLATRADGLRTVEEILFECGMEEAASLKILYALVAAGALEIAVLGQGARAGGRDETVGLDLLRVVEKYNQAVGGDYFQILGLRRDATGYEVREAYERLAREFHPERFTGMEDTLLISRLEEIGRALAEAADVLSEDPVREEYARSLAD
jgi:CheY-like chemotaxis protein